MSEQRHKTKWSYFCVRIENAPKKTKPAFLPTEKKTKKTKNKSSTAYKWSRPHTYYYVRKKGILFLSQIQI